MSRLTEIQKAIEEYAVAMKRLRISVSPDESAFPLSTQRQLAVLRGRLYRR